MCICGLRWLYAFLLCTTCARNCNADAGDLDLEAAVGDVKETETSEAQLADAQTLQAVTAARDHADVLF